MAVNITVFTKNFGKTFTGATIATFEVLKRSRGLIGELTVICKNYDEQSIEEVEAKVVKVDSLFNSFKTLKRMPKDNLYLNDDHFGFILAMLNKKYIHWYHGNWPDALFANFELFLKGLILFPLYIFTILGAKVVINVSDYMSKFTSKINKNSQIIRNGIKKQSKNIKPIIKFTKPGATKILMVGNIDKRKFTYAKKVFSMLSKDLSRGVFEIHIYGGINNRKLAEEILAYQSVHHKGFSSSVPYTSYDLLLSTSTMENLSIAICEALINHLPVICFDVGGLSEVVINERNGLIIPAKKADKMSLALLKFAQGTSSFQKFDDDMMGEYDWDIASEKFKTLIKSV